MPVSETEKCKYTSSGVLVQFDPHGPLPPLGELNGVAQQVHENLAKTAGIADHCVGNIVRNMVYQFKALRVGLESQSGHGIGYGISRLKSTAIQAQFPRLHLGEVKTSLITRSKDCAEVSTDPGIHAVPPSIPC